MAEAEEIIYSSSFFENLTGISSNVGSAGIFLLQNINHPVSFLINSFGYNNSPSPYGIESAISSGIYTRNGNLENCTGKSLLGNGIYAKRSILENCIGIAGATSVRTYYSFVLDTAGTFNNCVSNVGVINSYPMSVVCSESPLASGSRRKSYISNCNFSSNNQYSVLINAEAFPYSITIQNSIIKCSTDVGGGSPLVVSQDTDSIVHMQNCQVSGRDGIVISGGSTLDNNFIEVGSNENFAIRNSNTTFGNSALVGYTNNIIKGATTTNGGVSNIIQIAYWSSFWDSEQGNINYISYPAI